MTSNSTGVCTVSGFDRLLRRGRPLLLTAHVAQGTDYAADGIAQTFSVRARRPRRDQQPPGSGTYGGSFTPTVSTTGDGTKSVTSTSTGVCTVNGLVVSYVGVGPARSPRTSPGTDYIAADGTAQTFSVGKATTKTALKLSTTKVTYGHAPPSTSGSRFPRSWQARSRPGPSLSRPLHGSAVCDHTLVRQGIVHVVRQETQRGHLPPRRHLRRQHEIQRLGFGQEDPHHRQVRSCCLVALGVAIDR